MKGYARQRSSGKWEITIDIGRDPSTDKRLRHFETVTGGKKEAQHRLAELLLNIKRGTYVKQPKQLTVAAWLTQWLDSYVASTLSPKTRESYEQELRCYVIPDLGAIRLVDLRPHHIQSYFARALSEGRRHSIGGLSSRTVQYHYRILSKSLDDAVRMGLIAVNACKGVSAPRPVRRDIPSTGLDDINKLLSAIQDTSYYLFYYTLLLTGLRRSELLALKWKDLDLDLACIYVAHSLHRLDDGSIIIKEPKTSRSRRPVDLPPSLAILLRRYKTERQTVQILTGKALADDDFVFSHADGTPVNPNTVSHTFSKAVARAGLPPMRLHDLRNIHATMLLKAGTHPRIVQERLGHSSIATTLDIYSHTVPGLQKAAAERFDTLLPAQENVGKMSADDDGFESEPCGIRTHDTLIKSHGVMETAMKGGDLGIVDTLIRLDTLTLQTLGPNRQAREEEVKTHDIYTSNHSKADHAFTSHRLLRGMQQMRGQEPQDRCLVLR